MCVKIKYKNTYNKFKYVYALSRMVEQLKQIAYHII